MKEYSVLARAYANVANVPSLFKNIHAISQRNRLSIAENHNSHDAPEKTIVYALLYLYKSAVSPVFEALNAGNQKNAADNVQYLQQPISWVQKEMYCRS